MKVILSKDEIALVLDALANMPLARSYNLFQRLVALVNEPEAPPAPPPEATS